MKRIASIFLFSFIHLVSYAQNVNFAWAKQAGGIDGGSGYSIAVDATGNVYITGFFGGSNSSAGYAFLSKYNTSGMLLWTKQFIGTHSYVTAITIDVSGNILTTGLFDGTVDFDPGPGTFNLTAISAHQFISKLDAAGNFIWAKQIGGNVLYQNVYVSSIATDSQGNVFTTGSFDGPSIDFDPGPGVYTFNSNYWPEIFVSKLDIAGNFVWAKQMEEVGVGFAFHGSWANSIAVDAIGNVYTTGRFANEIDFDPGPGVFYLYQTTENYDAFISKLDAAGSFVWAKQLKGQTPDAAAAGISIALDALGNIYTAGRFGDTVDFDPGPGTWYLNNSNGGGYISKLDATGNFISAKAFGAGSVSITLDASGNIYSAGYFYGTADFDPGAGIFNLTAAGSSDIFISKSDAAGNFIWVKQIGGTGDDFGLSIALDTSRNIYTTGSFAGQVDFDPGPGIYNLTSAGYNNVFVFKLNQCANSTSSSITTSACSDYTLNGQTYTSSGIYTQTLSNATGCDSIITLNLTISRISTLINASVCKSYTWNNQSYSTSGTYTDTLVAANGCDSVVTLNLTISPKSFSTITQSICRGQTYLGHSTSGIYIDTLVAAGGCDSIRTLQLTVLPKPAPDLGADEILCSGDSLVLFPGQFMSYTWQDGSTQSHFMVKQPGLYSVVVTTACDSAKDEIKITASTCDIYFPSAFTPNDDGKNDWFKILGGYNLKDYHLVIYDRWGQKVFETFDYSKGWNGSFNGQQQPSATFVWFCEFKKSGNTDKTKMNGTVTLIR